ncbi:MAG: DUF4912 domain-containing protein [Candidatus Omnitrophica bacterium]|nr:DUF4912 domain-containing protein [Candidatus Omnitrophota bacterium]MDD5610607.1 DUF4912 domain-containing protein [Candidatus Omnitrophota bacterium]
MGLLDKIKNKIKTPKKTSRQSRVVKSKKRITRQKLRVEPKRQDAAIAVEEAKFYTGPQMQPAARPPVVSSWELPSGYGMDEIVIQVRDPWWLHAYWEVTPSTLGRLRNELGDAFHNAKRTLRVYDVSFIIFDGTNANRFFDIEVVHDVNNWYIDTQAPGRSWCVDFGFKLSDGRFITVARSNVVTTPLDGPSWQTDEEWMIPDDLFARLYGMGVGTGSSPVGIKKLWQERLKREFASGGVSSPGFSPVKKAQKRGFWLVVNTELIVYGATEPDAQLSVQGKPIQLRSDGTFSLRFTLPDGKQVIPVEAVSGDKVEKRTITPIVSKETK